MHYVFCVYIYTYIRKCFKYLYIYIYTKMFVELREVCNVEDLLGFYRSSIREHLESLLQDGHFSTNTAHACKVSEP